MQIRTAMQFQPNIPKERKISQSNVILEVSTEKFEIIQLLKTKTNIIQAQQLSIFKIYGQEMLMKSGDLL